MNQRPPRQAAHSRQREAARPWSRVRAVLLALLVLVSIWGGAAPAGATAIEPGPAESGSGTVDSSAFTQQTPPPTNNTTVRHRDPDEVASENRLDALQGVLTQRLSERLGSSAIQLNQQQYDRARSLLGDDYLDQLEKYADVADERDDEDAAAAAETYNDTRESQREYSRTVQAFRETYDEYQEAKANGNERRARELARELVRLGQTAARQSERLDENYDRLEDQAGADLTTTSREIQQIQTEIDDDRATVAATEFVDTTLDIRRADAAGSFSNPLEIAATLTSENGPVANQSITLAIGDQTIRGETDDEGQFSVTYRPTTVLVNRSTLTIQYVPATTSVYRATNATIPVTLSATTGNVSLTRTTSTAGFGDSVVVAGTVTVAGEPVSNLSLAVGVDDAALGTMRTNPSGAFTVQSPLPATPAPGVQQLTIDDRVEGRAVRIAPVNESLQVRETATNLSATVTRTDRGYSLTGRLTAAGRAVTDQRIVVSVSGDRLGTARTAVDGSFALRIDAGEANQTVTVSFDGSGTNLRSVETRVTIPPTDTGDDGGRDATTTPASAAPAVGDIVTGETPLTIDALLAIITTPVGLVLVGLLLGGGGLVIAALRRRGRRSTPDASAPVAESDTEPAAPARSDSAEPSPDEPVDSFSTAASALSEGTTDEAVVEAYAAVRAALATRLSADRARTHWQFFDACLAAVEDVDDDALRTLTETYETARYGAGSVSSTAAENALVAARSLLQPESGDEPAAVSDDD